MTFLCHYGLIQKLRMLNNTRYFADLHETMAEITKTFVKEGKTAEFPCPNCGCGNSVAIAKLGTIFRVKVKCRCQHIFVIEINVRGIFRKTVKLPASYHIEANEAGAKSPSGAKVNWETEHIPHRIFIGWVIDLSRRGIALQLAGKQHLRKDDLIVVVFKLDNTAGTEIRQQYRVQNVGDNRAGCSIVSDNKEINFYLLS